MQHDKNGSELGTRDNPIELTDNMFIMTEGNVWHIYDIQEILHTNHRNQEEYTIVIEAESAT